MKIEDHHTCYICGKPATSSEHVPAKCFFPENKRINLIEVPSCKNHNENTSKDDEYARFIISSYFGNNDIGKSHSIEKGIKPIFRSDALRKTIIENTIPATIVNKDYSTQTSKAIQIDRNRFDKEMRKNAYALFYYEYGKRWNRELCICTHNLNYQNGEVDECGKISLRLKNLSRNIETAYKYKGENPDVFKYCFFKVNDSEFDKVLHMIFYKGFEIWVFPINNTSGPKL